MELSHWRVTPNCLLREVAFNTFSELTAFLARLGPVADKMDHHPDLTVHSAVILEIRLVTHDVQSVTDRDLALAVQIDLLLADY